MIRLNSKTIELIYSIARTSAIPNIVRFTLAIVEFLCLCFVYFEMMYWYEDVREGISLPAHKLYSSVMYWFCMGTRLLHHILQGKPYTLAG